MRGQIGLGQWGVIGFALNAHVIGVAIDLEYGVTGLLAQSYNGG